MLKEIRTDSAPAPVGPYVQAIRSGNTLYCSGQIALDAKTGTMVGSNEEEQTVKVMDNIAAVLAAAGLSYKHIAKTTIFLTNLQAFQTVNAVYEKKLAGHKPARSTVEVRALPKAALVEIECIAIFE